MIILIDFGKKFRSRNSSIFNYKTIKPNIETLKFKTNYYKKMNELKNYNYKLKCINNQIVEEVLLNNNKNNDYNSLKNQELTEQIIKEQFKIKNLLNEIWSLTDKKQKICEQMTNDEKLLIEETKQKYESQLMNQKEYHDKQLLDQKLKYENEIFILKN